MSEVIKNRYEFVILFDVEILMREICRALIRKVVWDLLQTFA